MKNKKMKMIIIAVATIATAASILMYNSLIYKESHEYKEKLLVSNTDNIKVNEEFFSKMSEKEFIHYKIINKVDFLNTVRGTYTYHAPIENNYSDDYKAVEYCVDTKKQLSNDKISVQSYNTQNELTLDYQREIVYRNGESVNFNDSDRLYSIQKYSNEDIEGSNVFNSDIVRKLTPKERYTEDNKFIRRNDEVFLECENQSLQPNYINFLTDKGLLSFNSLLLDYDNWKIEGEEEYLGRQAVNIVMEINLEEKNREYVSEKNYIPVKLNASIDKETGILLSYIVMNESNGVFCTMETKSIDFDCDINYSIFEKSIEGYEIDTR